MGQNIDEETTANYVTYIFILITVSSFIIGWNYFQRADIIDEEWREGQESGTMTNTQAWNLFSVAMSYRGFGFALFTAGAAFFGTSMAFYLQSRPRKSDDILTTQLQLIRQELLVMQNQLQRVIENLMS